MPERVINAVECPLHRLAHILVEDQDRLQAIAAGQLTRYQFLQHIRDLNECRFMVNFFPDILPLVALNFVVQFA